ncbi:hypothetical protein U9258_23220 [Escherichia coli]|nr:hypothetical protein [Escherichia coli]EFN4064631.1 hypothetical protein [Escherichia coli]EHH5068056.1 hypothetical protein [Escherichia coli]EID8807144.1 hypothetical protein [Escherichia coli]EIP0551701.1 hypothetical protein [Escherichia coli]
MKKNYRCKFFMIMFVASMKVSAADYNHKISVSIDRNKVPSGGNVHVADIDVSKVKSPYYGPNGGGLECDTYMTLCARAWNPNYPVYFNVTPVAYHKDELKRSVSHNVNNKDFLFTINYQNINYRLTFYNGDTGSTQHMDGILGDSQQFRPNRSCQQFITGCKRYESRSYLKSGIISISVKLPSDIKGGVYAFNNVNLGRFVTSYLARPNVEISGSSYLYLSGTITLPDRCYLSLSNKEINFNAIKATENNGWIAQKTISLASTCVGNDKPVKLDIKIQPISGSSVTNNHLDLAKDSQGNPALGIFASFLDTTQCQSDYTYNTFSNVGTMMVATTGSATIDQKIYFNLCKYGIPTTGTHNASVNIVARWTQN